MRIGSFTVQPLFGHRHLTLFALAIVLGTIIVLIAGLFSETQSTRALNPNIQNQFDLAIDTEISGNSTSSLGALDPCVAVVVNDTFDVDLVVQGVPEPGIAGLEANIIYDPAILRVVGKDITSYMLGVGGAAISLGDAFDPIPSGDGDLYLGELNLGSTLATGDGVVVRLTFEALAAGGSSLTWDNTNPADPDYVPTDWNWDGIPDVYYVDLEAQPDPEYIGIFPNMRARGAEVVVDGTCPGNFLDGDGDGFGDLYEDYTETLVVQRCAQTPVANDEQFDSSPVDFDNNQKVDTTDVLQLKPVFLQSSAGNERYDLHPSGSIDTTDVLAFKPVFLQTCTP